MKTILSIMCHCCLGIGLVWNAASASAEVIDKIAAILDGELILLSEIREHTEMPIVKILANLQDSSDSEQGALMYEVERRLLDREIHYLAFPKEQAFVKLVALEYLAVTYHQKSGQELQQSLEDQGFSDASLEEELLLYMKGVDYIRRKYRFSSDIEHPSIVLNLFRQWLKELKAQAKIQLVP